MPRLICVRQIALAFKFTKRLGSSIRFVGTTAGFPVVFLFALPLSPGVSCDNFSASKAYSF